MEPFCPPWKLHEVPFRHFRECIEKGPEIPTLEDLMLWFPPLLQDRRNLPGSCSPYVSGPDDQIVGGPIIQALSLVCLDTLILVMPPLHEPADCLLRDRWNVTKNEPRVFPRDFDLAAEAEVVADEDLRACHETCWKPLVMRIAYTQHIPVVRMIASVLNFDQTEISVLVVGAVMARAFPSGSISLDMLPC
jgi:hypothetical protein